MEAMFDILLKWLFELPDATGVFEGTMSHLLVRVVDL
jgi:hypothetical protein